MLLILILILSSSKVFTTQDLTAHWFAHNLLAVSLLQRRRPQVKLISDIKKKQKKPDQNASRFDATQCVY